MLRLVHAPFVVLILAALGTIPQPVYSESTVTYLVHPGDTWESLALRLGLQKQQLIEQQSVVNPWQQPVIGSTLSLYEFPRTPGTLSRSRAGGLLEQAAVVGRSPWILTLQNELPHPFRPTLYDLMFDSTTSDIPRELPVGFRKVSLSDAAARPGQTLVLQGLIPPDQEPQISLGQDSWLVHKNRDRLVALGTIHAFFGDGTPELQITTVGEPAWTQPVLVEDQEWQYDRVNFPASAATDPAELEQERVRLREIWAKVTPVPLWSSEFSPPLRDYVSVSSQFGARRSVNGGPFDTYHEGTDFSAFRGSEVVAPAGGQIVLAEVLNVRGGAVIIDHGLGIHSGYYHLSEISVAKGDRVDKGDVLGEVGSTGRSTGNHLHWDFLIGTSWVDPQHWMDSNLDLAILSWWGTSIQQTTYRDSAGDLTLAAPKRYR